MTDDRIALCQLVEKSSDADLLLAIILHRIWRDGTEFRWRKEVPQAA